MVKYLGPSDDSYKVVVNMLRKIVDEVVSKKQDRVEASMPALSICFDDLTKANREVLSRYRKAIRLQRCPGMCTHHREGSRSWVSRLSEVLVPHTTSVRVVVTL